MKKLIILLLIIICGVHELTAQKIDITSVDEFFNIASKMKEGKHITENQWMVFDSTGGYREYSTRRDQIRINIIKKSLDLTFNDNNINILKDSILNINEEIIKNNSDLRLAKMTLINFIDIKDNFDSIKAFRDNYDFNNLINIVTKKLGSFLGKPVDSRIRFLPVYFLFQENDSQTRENGIYIDFNSFYKKTEEQRINLLAHEFFHNYRKWFENSEFNRKNYLYYYIDVIQNEGIADLIDKSEGYRKYFISNGFDHDMVENWNSLYVQAPKDLERLQNLMIKFSKKKVTEVVAEKEIHDIVKYNGHPIGFYMACKIVNAGYKEEMLKTLYNPYEFFRLYNKAAKKQNDFQLNDTFMSYLNNIIKKYYK